MSGQKAADLPVVILAGGLATRLGTLTERIPKALLEVAGEPFLAHQLRLLRNGGLKRLVLCVGHLGEQIVEHFGNGEKHGIRIDYVFDGPSLLGTGGAIIQALPSLGKAFYVLYGDSYLPIDFLSVGDAFLASEKQALMTVYRNEGRHDSSNVQFENGRILCYDKKNRSPAMHHIDYGLGLFQSSAFAAYPRNAVLDLSQIQGALAARGELEGFEVFSRFYEIGSPAGLAELDTLLRERKLS